MNTNTNEESEATRAGIIKQATVDKQLAKINVAYQRFYGFFGGCALGFIFSIALFFILLIVDQKYSGPKDEDFANPIGVIFFVFTSTCAGGVLGAILCPVLISAIGKAVKKQQ